MKVILPLFLISLIGCSCRHSSGGNSLNVNSKDEQPQTAELMDSIPMSDELSPYRCVIDTINSAGNGNVDSGYFLFDITGDGKPELWIKTGTCEADYQLMAYTLDSGNPRKIYDGEGGHSDYFVFNGQLVCVMCNTGAGVVISYHYDGNCVTESMVEFSTWNENGDALSDPHDPIADEKLRFWEDNSEDFIEIYPL